MSKRVISAVGSALVCIIGLAASAWACTNQAHIAVAGDAVAAGRVVRVEASGFEPRPVELRWNDTQSPVVATAQGPDFSADVTVPADAKPGFYYLVATQTSVPGHAIFKSTDTVEVTDGGAAPTRALSSDLWNGFSSRSVQGADENIVSTTNRSGGRMPLGLALAGAGGIGMLMAGAVLVTSRRRARSTGSNN